MRRIARVVALAAVQVSALMGISALEASVAAQTVVVIGPAESTIPTTTPTFTIKALDFPVTSRPLFFTLFISRNASAETGDIETLTQTGGFSIGDTIVTLRVTRPLPHITQVYWRARVNLETANPYFSSVTGPRLAPSWLTLVSPIGGTISERQPTLKWESAPIDAEVGAFEYEFEVFDPKGPFLSGTTGEKSILVPKPLEANLRYTWRVTARAPGNPTAPGGSVTVNGPEFRITDPTLPTTTILYQNFPNPFPSASSLNTCIWFDVGGSGARITLDVLDLRGSLVKRIITPSRYDAGKYGPGSVNSGIRCDTRFMWDGTDNNGRFVAPGVYMIRFTANGKATFKKMLFKGR